MLACFFPEGSMDGDMNLRPDYSTKYFGKSVCALYAPACVTRFSSWRLVLGVLSPPARRLAPTRPRRCTRPNIVIRVDT